MVTGRSVGGDAVAHDLISLFIRELPQTWTGRVVGSVMGILAVAFQMKIKGQGND